MPVQVVVDLDLSASVETVWKALREPTLIANWFGWESDSLADEIDYIFFTHAIVDDDARTLRFAEWEGIYHQLKLSPLGAKTRLTLALYGAPEIDWTGIYDDLREGWVTFFQQLRFALERHPDETRRTIYLSGTTGSGAQDLRTTLGLHHSSITEARHPLPTPSPLGKLTGEAWHKTDFQQGLTVDQWGDGLLVVTDKSPATGSVIINTFGLNENDFNDLRNRWNQWWRDNRIT